MNLVIGKVIHFKLQNQLNEWVDSSTLLGQKLVLFFYPKDNTSGCTIEAKEFSNLIAKFSEKGVKVFGISKDSASSHSKFIAKCDLKTPLLVDTDAEFCQSLGILVEKSMYGRKYLGIARTTLLLDEEHKLAKIWTEVKPQGHAAEVLAAI